MALRVFQFQSGGRGQAGGRGGVIHTEAGVPLPISVHAFENAAEAEEFLAWVATGDKDLELASTPELECLLHDWSYIRNAEPCNECKSTKNLSLRRRKQGWVLECGCGDCCHEGFGFQPWNAVQDWYERMTGDVDREGHP